MNKVYRSCHILDLVISRKDAEAFKVDELAVMEKLISDHKAAQLAKTAQLAQVCC